MLGGVSEFEGFERHCAFWDTLATSIIVEIVRKRSSTKLECSESPEGGELLRVPSAYSEPTGVQNREQDENRLSFCG